MKPLMLITVTLFSIGFYDSAQAAVVKAVPTKNGAKFQSKIKRSNLKLVNPGGRISTALDQNGNPILNPAGASAGGRIGNLLKQFSTSSNSNTAGDSAGGSGAGGGASNSGGGTGTQSTTYDDNAAKGEGPGKGPNSAGDLSGGGGPQNKPGKIEAYDRWFPACIFLSPSVGNGNAMVKGAVDMAAKCGVNLVVFPFYVKSTPGSPQAINAQARQSCNAIQGMGSQGVNRVASATVTGNPAQAAKMCGAGANDRDTCEDLTYNPGEVYKQRYRMTGRGAEVNPTGSGIVGRNTPQALATTIFRQITGLPYGAGAGLGLGSWNEGDASAAGLAKSDGLNDFGCNELRNRSLSNDGRWKYNSGQETYIVKGDSERMFDLGKPIFTPPASPGAGGQASKSGDSGSASGSESGGAAASGSGAAGAKSFGSSASGAGSGSVDVATGGAGHKKPPGGFGAPDAGAASNAGGSGAKTIGGGYAASSDGGGAAGDVTSQADSANGAAGGASEVVKVGAGRGPASVGGAGGARTEYDDKANKVDTSISASQLNAVGKGSGGAAGNNLDSSYLNKKTKSEVEAEAAAALVASKRPRVFLEGEASSLNADYLKKMKMGRRTNGGKAYNGPISNGEVTTLRRETPAK